MSFHKSIKLNLQVCKEKELSSMDNEYEHDEMEHLKETDRILEDFQELIINKKKIKQDYIEYSEKNREE